MNGPEGYECLCPRGYKGKRCKQRENPCKNSPCGVGGRCKILTDKPWGSISCECRRGYSGQYCGLIT